MRESGGHKRKKKMRTPASIPRGRGGGGNVEKKKRKREGSFIPRSMGL